MCGQPNALRAISHPATFRSGYCPIFIYLIHLFNKLITVD